MEKRPKSKTTSTEKPTDPKKTTYTASELAALSRGDLVAYALSLQNQLRIKSNTASSSTELTPQEVAASVNHLATMMERQIRKSMTWKPSCKTGTAKFSQDFIVASEQVFKELFKPVAKQGDKGWKMKKFSLRDFEVRVTLLNSFHPPETSAKSSQRVVGQEIRASSRYCELVPTSDITVRWDAANRAMKCSGKYGKLIYGQSALVVTDDEDE